MSQKLNDYSFYCPDLENDCHVTKPTEAKSYCARIDTSQDVNAYIESHPLSGCILAEVLCHPENVVLVETKRYKSRATFEKWVYKGEPIIQCGVNCPFSDCEASYSEYLGNIARNRIQTLAQEVVGARLI